MEKQKFLTSEEFSRNSFFYKISGKRNVFLLATISPRFQTGTKVVIFGMLIEDEQSF